MREARTVQEIREFMHSMHSKEELPTGLLASRKLHRSAVSRAKKKLERLKLRNARTRAIKRAEAKLAKVQQTMENRKHL